MKTADNSQHDSLHRNEQPHLPRYNQICLQFIWKKQPRVPMEYITEFWGVNLCSMHHGIPKTSFIKVEDLLIEQRLLYNWISPNIYNYICSIIQSEAPCRYLTNTLGSITVKACWSSKRGIMLHANRVTCPESHSQFFTEGGHLWIGKYGKNYGKNYSRNYSDHCVCMADSMGDLGLLDWLASIG